MVLYLVIGCGIFPLFNQSCQHLSAEQSRLSSHPVSSLMKADTTAVIVHENTLHDDAA
jgi:hypothetical protein